MNSYSFSGANGTLDRKAEWRRDPARLAQLFDQSAVLPLWRGKAAFDPVGAGLLWLPPTHPLIAARKATLFLGVAADRPLFAVDVSGWQPPVGDAPEAGFLDSSIQNHPDLALGTGFVDLRSVMTVITPLDGECAATAKALFTWHDSHGFCAKCGDESAVTDAGWQRRCPTCEAGHFPRTDPVVIMLVTKGDKLLLGRSPGWPVGMYSLLAGFVEPGETLESAVRREVFEETSVQIGPVRYLDSQPWPFPTSLMLGAVATALTDTISLDPIELEDARWVSRQDVLHIQLGMNAEMTAGRKGAIAQYLITKWLADKID